MDNTNISTVAFRSNLQPITGSYREDRHFLSTIHDPFALELMKKAGFGAVSPIQQQEFQSASLHCAYAFPGDYPFGTVVDNATFQKRVICKCTNVGCALFSKCRPDFNRAELAITEENVFFHAKVQEILSETSGKGTEHPVQMSDGDQQAAAALYSNSLPVIEEAATVPPVAPPVLVEFHHDGITADDKVEVADFSLAQDATFDSFIESDQDAIIKLFPAERTIVNAGPGTGKTWTLIEKIKYMLTDAAIDPANILVLCFSRAAVEVIQKRLENAAQAEELPLNWHEVEVRTFDSFATYLLSWSKENKPEVLPYGYNLEGESYDQRIQTSTSVIQKFQDLLAEYEHVIVDEVQDLVGVRAEMVLALLHNLPDACGFTLLGDSCQALYDYLAVNDKSVIDSQKFYHSIFHSYNNANYFSLVHNYRQGDDFGALTLPYRQAILTGDASARASEAKELNTQLVTSKIDLKKISAKDVVMLQKTGSLGILTRTNGQALQISSWLRTEGINHTLQKPAGSHSLASWIAKTLTNAETDVIDNTEFSALFSAAYPDKGSEAPHYWQALISTQADETKRHYEIENILRGLLQNSRNSLLFDEPTDSPDDIVVSNIHRAKGREFDSVLILNDVLEGITDDKTDDILEHKVCYVALTRPKKKIEKVMLKPQYIYISHDETRRCFRAGGFGNRKYLSHFEVVDNSDLNTRSFARTIAIQDLIQDMPSGTRLKLVKCPEGKTPCVTYSIVPEEDEHIVIGYTTAMFARCMEKAIQRIYSSNSPIAYKYFPSIFRDVYCDRLNTCISSSDAGIPGAKKFGNMNIWYGLEISGFAQIEKDRY